MDENKPKALIAMSGGVDSSVAAYEMIRQGYECIGCTMKLYDNEDACISKGHTCCSLDDVEDARSVAARLGMPYYVFNFTEEFREKIIGRFVRSYLEGRTPNPCIDCNRYMKFDRLYERARQLGCECVVTGHYAQIVSEGGKYVLKKGVDPSKDQSYVLYSLTQEQLARTRFPLGSMRKTDARRIAEENGFVNAHKHDSQDICFVPDGDYARVIEAHTGSRAPEGNFVSPDGRVLGKHRGIIHYTIGQRRGLGLNWHEPLFVCRICPKTNEIVLGSTEDLLARVAIVRGFNWISGDVPEGTIHCSAKIRYRHGERPASVTALGDGSVRIEFDEPVSAITPGQAAVLYDGDTVLGGGTIAVSEA